MYSDVRSNSQHVDHSSHAKAGTRPFPDRLYVVTPISNPKRYNARYEHYRAFEKRCEDAGAILYTIEAAFGDRDFEVTSPDNPRNIQLRTNDEIWHKENLINLAIARLPLDAEYIAWVDADLTFSRPDWVQETLHQLQHFDFVQMFSHIVQLGPNSDVMNSGVSFMEGWRRGIPFKTSVGEASDNTYKAGRSFGMMDFEPGSYGGFPFGESAAQIRNWFLKHSIFAGKSYPEPSSPKRQLGWCGAPGGAWAATRSALDAVGGLIDFAVLGSGDYHMALGLMGMIEFSLNGGYHPQYIEALTRWQRLAETHVMRNVGHVAGTIMHHWHGKMSSRGYSDRWKILVKHQFNPITDLIRDRQGLYQLSPQRWELRDDIRSYFASRNEDGIDT